MALKESKDLELGTEAPNFKLLDTVTDKYLSLEEVKGQNGTLVMFIANHCPYVQHYNPTLVELAEHYQIKGIKFVAISSNDINQYPDDAPEKMKQVAQKLNYSFPYLYDETQQTAKDYQAECTPDFYLFDKNQKLFYHGQLDESRPNNQVDPSARNMKEAIETLLHGAKSPFNQQPSIGCSIKWKV